MFDLTDSIHSIFNHVMYTEVNVNTLLSDPCDPVDCGRGMSLVI